jgi:hypothetical protein
MGSPRVLWLVAVVLTVAFAARAQLQAFERGEVTIETAAGIHRFAVEIADTEAERAQGLMFREKLGAEEGMLFVYPSDRVVGMWMKNTLIPLDMLFIAADGRVLGIVERTVPHSTATVSSEEPVRAVLELNGGTVARLGIGAGAKVRLPALTAE